MSSKIKRQVCCVYDVHHGFHFVCEGTRKTYQTPTSCNAWPLPPSITSTLSTACLGRVMSGLLFSCVRQQMPCPVQHKYAQCGRMPRIKAPSHECYISQPGSCMADSHSDNTNCIQTLNPKPWYQPYPETNTNTFYNVEQGC